MHATNFDIERCSPIAPDRPIEIVQTAERTAAIIKVLILLPLTLAMLAPFVALAMHVIAEPATRSLVIDKPHSVVQLGIALVAVSVLLGWPLHRIMVMIGARRDVLIDQGMVSVDERRIFGAKRWQLPLAHYRGIAHRVRTSLSGTRHELVLIHADPRRSVLLGAADRLSEDDVRQAAAVLRLAVLPASVLYRVTPVPQPAGVDNKVKAQIAS